MTIYKDLNNRSFEVRNSKYTAMCIGNILAEMNSAYSVKTKALKTLDECYETPSTAKKSIYEDWLDWCTELNKSDEPQFIYPFGIRSYNTFGFTLCGFLRDSEDEIIGLVEITKTRNTLYML